METRHAVHGRQIGSLGGCFHQGISLSLITPCIIYLGQHVHGLGIPCSIRHTPQQPVGLIRIQFPALPVLEQLRGL